MFEIALTAALMFPAKPEPVLTFATYNVCKTSCGTGRFAWDRRKAATVRNILSARPDVLALQEADNSYWFYATELGKHGYARLIPDEDNCRGTCVPDSQLFYRTAVVTPVVTDVRSDPRPAACEAFPVEGPLEPEYPQLPPEPGWQADPQEWQRWYELRDQLAAQYEAAYEAYLSAVRAYLDAGCPDYTDWQPLRPAGSASQSLAAWGTSALAASVQDRNLTWGLFRDRRTGGAFMAVSIHLPNEKSPKAEKYRKHLARTVTPQLQQWREKVGAPSLPTVLMGDLNSFAYRQPRGAHWILGKQGFRDAYSAARKVNGDVTTVNTSATTRNPFPPRPRRSKNPTRIDYVLVDQGKALRYEVHLRLKGARFDNRYRGSDHNLVMAELKLSKVGLPGSFRDR
ncbi:MAG: endonuclease/exonuclease/phosphatase family protein [Candidatus Nanopelagicales bacterium]